MLLIKDVRKIFHYNFISIFFCKVQKNIQLMTILWGPKYDGMGQLVLGKKACGMPYAFEKKKWFTTTTHGILVGKRKEESTLAQFVGSTVLSPFWTSVGTQLSDLAQNQTLMKSFVLSTANLKGVLGVGHIYIVPVFIKKRYHPPPCSLKFGPKLFESFIFTPHPALPVAATSQLSPVENLFRFSESGTGWIKN